MRKFVVFFLIVYLITSCNVCVNEDTQDFIETPIIKEETVTKTLTGTLGKTLYLVKMNPTSKMVPAAASGYVYSNENLDILNDNDFIYENESRFVRKDNPIALEFYSKQVNSSRSMRSFNEVEYNVNDERKFWIMKKEAWLIQNIEWEEIPAKLRAKGEFCYIWVPDEYWGEHCNSVSEEIVTKLKEKFDSIYPRVTNVFGYPDSVENLKIHILIFDIYSDSENGQVFGYFMPKDYGIYEETYRSNECCMFYLDAFLTRKLPNMAYSTLAHEFQHMINYYNKTLRASNTEGTQTWFTEMMSMLCEDMLQTFLGIDDNDSPILRMKDFNSGYYTHGITEWQNNTSYSYACVYAFGAYLVRNFGGIKLLEAIAKNKQTNKSAIEKALKELGKELGYDETFDSVFLKFSQALIYEDSDKLTLNKEITETFGDYEYRFKAFNIWDVSYRQGFKKIYGPYCFNPSERLQLRPYGFTIHTQDSWQKITTDTLTINLIRPEGSGIDYQFILK